MENQFQQETEHSYIVSENGKEESEFQTPQKETLLLHYQNLIEWHLVWGYLETLEKLLL